jgi:hypothetical protein
VHERPPNARRGHDPAARPVRGVGQGVRSVRPETRCGCQGQRVLVAATVAGALLGLPV